jgi:putative DNA primase/helicase
MITEKLTLPQYRTDNANATSFITRYGDRLRYVSTWGCWIVWTGRKWCLATGDNQVGSFAREFAHSLWGEAATILEQTDASDDQTKQMLSFVKQSNDSRRIESLIKLSRHDRRVSIQHDLLNADPMLLNLRNGTFDLKSMRFQGHQPEDLITQQAEVNYEEGAECPMWESALNLIFNNDRDLISYVQQILGYSITGDIGEHILPIAYGSGCNGKSTIWNVIISLLGDYAMLANESLLLGAKDGHPTEKAMLYQKRFVPIGEPERNSQLRESRVKELTGDAFITARRMKEDFWSFRRTHKFFLATNHLPKIDGSDEGIWRRIKLIPFLVDIRKVATPDPDMVDKLLQHESSGILNWLIKGWQSYRQQGFIEPAAVSQATAGYRSDSDLLGAFIDENCVLEEGAIVTADELYKQYLNSGGKESKANLCREMAERFRKEKPSSGQYRKKVIYHGIRLISENERQQNNAEKTEQFLEVPSSALVNSINSLESQTREVTEKPGALGGKVGSEVCFCGMEMVPTPAEEGWVNWDCAGCGAVRPKRTEAV